MGCAECPRPIAAGIRYSLTRWDGLSRFLDDGRVDLDSNAVERSIRPLALNPQELAIRGITGWRRARRSHLFGHRTAKLNGIEPQAYIADVIEKIAGGWPASRWDELMPWNWTADEQPLIAEAA